MIQRVISVLTIGCGLAFGQAASASNSVTVTASRNPNIQPDQVVFNVQVNTPLDGTLDTAVSALQGSGITAANFSGIGSQQQFNPAKNSSQTLLVWYFSLTVAMADMKSTIGLLSAVQTSIGNKNNGISISFGVQGLQSSPQAQQAAQCSPTDLMNDAKAQAQKLATAAGKGLGAVLAMSSATNTIAQTNGLISSTISTPACTMTVKFQLAGL